LFGHILTLIAWACHTIGSEYFRNLIGKRMIVSLRVVALVAALTSIGMAQRAAAVGYAIQRFDTLPNGRMPIPADIDNFGSIAGHFLSSGVSTGFVLDTSGGFVTFNSPGRNSTQPRGMNNIGQVVGMINDPILDAPLAFLRQPNGDLLEFEVPSDLSFVANDINDLGQIVGTRRFVDGRADVFVREPDGAMRYFDLTTDEPETAVGINNHGQVTGLFDIYGYILDISTGNVTPFKPKFGYVVPDGINNHGDVVGHWDEGDDGNKGFVYTSNGNYRLFNASFPGLEETNPAGINDLDQIVGTYYYETGQGLSQSGFIATPVPEPSSFAILCIGIAGALVVRRRFGLLPS
jgi:hypothetical protein